MGEQQEQNYQEVFQRCQHTDEQRQLDCWHERANQCFRCKLYICQEHTRDAMIGLSWYPHCVGCYDTVLSLHERRE